MTKYFLTLVSLPLMSSKQGDTPSPAIANKTQPAREKQHGQRPSFIIYTQTYRRGLTPHSNATTAIPLDAPLPANPTKCSAPILLANRDAPIYRKTTDFHVLFLLLTIPSLTETKTIIIFQGKKIITFCCKRGQAYLTGSHCMDLPARK